MVWVSSVQWLLTGEHSLDVNSVTAAAVIMTVLFLSLTICCTAGATGRSRVASTRSSYHCRAT